MENTGRRSIFIGAGANLAHPTYGSPRQTLEAAFRELARRGVQILRVSPWYRTAPVPASDQPWYENAVIEVGTDFGPDKLLATLHEVEQAFGRVRTVANAARMIDLDLLDFRGEIAPESPGRATLPHPRLAARAFVLRPLADLAPDWRHPVTGESSQALLAALPFDEGRV
ncbi:2-amino-4-hydroxy-6-hydroxymethyldihydropteridine diphosphokinase [Reyranella sp.]|uniref:2-amino-4-hydroxy-6- hydroxymethyldihydropteridine diphosphokinase n=1 Tax=Reyranella sp. TaxID=1929291 RepID=UPI0025E57D97|nr:2-amino-4-hydroxy-6-hydroxymethyldihydropteridine diphosphokinase [Reyranella sp.]